MDVCVIVPLGTSLDIGKEQYSDAFIFDYSDEEIEHHYYGRSHEDQDEDDDEQDEWLSYEEAVEFCGFIEGAIPEASCIIEGNGGWAQGMIRRKDFSSLASTDAEKASYKKTSDQYWEAFKRGEQKLNEKEKTQAVCSGDAP